MDYFVTYLKYLRDYYLLHDCTSDQEGVAGAKVTTLVAAVGEYEKYLTCISNYYKLSGNVIEKKTDEPDEEVMKRYNLERKFH